MILRFLVGMLLLAYTVVVYAGLAALLGIWLRS